MYRDTKNNTDVLQIFLKQLNSYPVKGLCILVDIAKCYAESAHKLQ